MKVLIIEDEKYAVQRIKRLVDEISYDINIIGELSSVEDSINWFSKNILPDLILMDIQLEDGTSFEIFENVNIKCPVIFTTAYEEYAIKAFKVNSIDYLLKPINAKELKAAFDKYKTLQKQNFELEGLLNSINPQKKERFLIKIGEHYKSIKIEEINYFFILDRNTFLNTNTNKNYPIDFSLDKVEQLINNDLFFRVNRNIIVNISAIKDIVSYSSNRLKLVINNWGSNDEVVVSRERVSEFKKWIDK